VSGYETNIHHATVACRKRTNASVVGNPEGATTAGDAMDFHRRITRINEAELVNQAAVPSQNLIRTISLVISKPRRYSLRSC
jgi:hypothetical protein